MSAPSERAAARCACTNITLMQLFHELKQKFPAAPDHAVSAAIAAYCHDKRACEQHLESHAAASLAHAYHASSSAAARKLKDLSANLVPIECRNRPIEQRQFPATSSIRAITCDKPQNAKLSINPLLDDDSDDLVEVTNRICQDQKNKIDGGDTNENDVNNLQSCDESPITINIDRCIEKSSESPSDVETEDISQTKIENSNIQIEQTNDSIESSNYRILKSSKIKSNLNERLEKPKEKNTTRTSKDITKETEQHEEAKDKPIRPCTLEFIKPQVDINISKKTCAPNPESYQAAFAADARDQTSTDTAAHRQWSDQGYPLNLSVNVNCHMDIVNRPHTLYPNPWLENYDSPRAFTSVNLTVCTPTSGTMQSPVRDAGPGERGFEGHVTVTVSPSSARAPRRVAPPPPSAASNRPLYQSTPTLEQPATVPENSLIARQLARKRLLEQELARERDNLARLTHETAVLAAPLPAPAAARRLRLQVEWLRDQCQRMSGMLDNHAHGAERDVYSRAYPGEREGVRTSPLPTRPAPPPPEDAPSWQCQICTFSNHGLLNKCEQCDMPRILLGTTRSVDSGVGSLTHETPLDTSVLLGTAAPNSAKPACV